MKPITILVNIRVRQTAVQSFLDLVRAHQLASRIEPGCRRFDVVRGTADPLHFALVEEWRDAEAVDAHRQTAHYLLWRERIAALEEFPRVHDEFEPAVKPVVVFTNGCWDGPYLHVGHLRVLEECCRIGDEVIIGVNGDASVRRLKGPSRPFAPLHVRVHRLTRFGLVRVFEDESELLDMIKNLRPEVLVKGSEASKPIPGVEYAQRVHLVPHLPGHSTTNLLRMIEAGCRPVPPVSR